MLHYYQIYKVIQPVIQAKTDFLHFPIHMNDPFHRTISNAVRPCPMLLIITEHYILWTRTQNVLTCEQCHDMTYVFLTFTVVHSDVSQEPMGHVLPGIDVLFRS